jgi:phage head maturation protease
MTIRTDPDRLSRAMAEGLARPANRAAALSPASLDEETRTVEVVWTTGARVLRGYFDQFLEELSLDPAHVRMDRLKSGTTPLLEAHQIDSTSRVLGVVESASLEAGRGTAVVRFARGDPAADLVWSKISQGIIRNVSVGYRTYKYEKLEGGDGKIPVFRAIDWEPFEISAVPVGADGQAHFRAEETHMESTTVPPAGDPGQMQAERQRAAAISNLVGPYARQLGPSFGERLIHEGVPIEQARALVLDALASRSEASPTVSHLRIDSEFGGEERVRLMPAPSDAARQYVRLRASDMARSCLEARGVSTGMMQDHQVVVRALGTTSDFPALLTDTGNRFLRQGYSSYQGGVVRICRQSSAPGFRAKSRLNLSEAPQLLQVNEPG